MKFILIAYFHQFQIVFRVFYLCLQIPVISIVAGAVADHSRKLFADLRYFACFLISRHSGNDSQDIVDKMGIHLCLQRKHTALNLVHPAQHLLLHGKLQIFN